MTASCEKSVQKYYKYHPGESQEGPTGGKSWIVGKFRQIYLFQVPAGEAVEQQARQDTATTAAVERNSSSEYPK